MINDPSHWGASLWTFSCISRRTRSPLLKVLVRRQLLWYVRSLSWYSSDFVRAVSHASSTVSLSSCSASSASSSSYPDIRGAPDLRSCGSTASAPYTMKKGVYWVAVFGVVRRLHNTAGSSSTQLPAACSSGARSCFFSPPHTRPFAFSTWPLDCGCTTCIVDFDAQLFTKVLEFCCCEVCTIIRDDVVWHPEPEDD